MIPVVALSLLNLALLAVHVYLQRENARERRELLDRLTVPQAAEAAAFARAIGATPPGPDLDAEDDRLYGRVLEDEFAALELESA